MKRKLIDIDEPTYATLKKVAAESGTNLKQYIEGLLDDKARRLEDGGGYSFSASREPSDRELAVIMKCAAESANMKKERTQEIFFSNLEEQIRNAGNN